MRTLWLVLASLACCGRAETNRPDQPPPCADKIGQLRKSLVVKAWSARWQAVRALGDAGPRARAAVPDLIVVLDGRDPLLRREAALALSRIAPDSDAVVNAFVRSLDRKGTDHGTVLGALKASGKKAKAAQAWLVRRLLSDARPDPHHRDLDLLKALDPPVAVYLKLLATASARVRVAVLVKLRDFGPGARAAIPALCAWIGDEDEYLRSEARATLKAIGASSLCSLLSPGRQTVKTTTRDGGTTIEDRSGLTVWLFSLEKKECLELIEILEDKKIGEDTRRQLGKTPFGADDAEQLELIISRREEAHQVHCALLLLPLIAQDLNHAERVVREATRDNSPAIRRAARDALNRIQGRKSATTDR